MVSLSAVMGHRVAVSFGLTALALGVEYAGVIFDLDRRLSVTVIVCLFSLSLYFAFQASFADVRRRLLELALSASIFALGFSAFELVHVTHVTCGVATRRFEFEGGIFWEQFQQLASERTAHAALKAPPARLCRSDPSLQIE